MNYWKQGADAFDAGIPMEQCPYAEGSHPYLRWTDGWIDLWYEFNYKRRQ